MKIVIQCAAGKEPSAGYMQTKGGKPVMFVGQLPGPQPDTIYATPDTLLEDRQVSWRTLLEEYNKSPENNPWNLYPAYKLYENEIYRKLANRFGVEHLYILSAGWGLIRADFLTPQYDITFSSKATKDKRRKKADHYQDFRMLPDDADGPIYFFGGKKYIPLFCSLTEKCRSRRIVFYNSAIPPDAPGCDLKRCVTKSRTNWHYECAKAFLNSATEI
jgi:hypothetical protein